MPSKKQIFKKPTAKQMMKGRTPVTARKNISERVLEMDPHRQYIIIDRSIIPKEFFYHGKSRRPLTAGTG